MPVLLMAERWGLPKPVPQMAERSGLMSQAMLSVMKSADALGHRYLAQTVAADKQNHRFSEHTFSYQYQIPRTRLGLLDTVSGQIS